VEYVLKNTVDGNRITVKDVQDVLLKMMKDIDELCKKNNIEYMLTSGTTLGAIRHKGFIPWDDDLDIAMMRDQYNKFIKVLEEQLSDEYVFHCFEKNKKYDVTWPAMKIRKKGTYVKEANTLLFNKCTDCDGIFIDIFIYDYMSNSTIIDLPFRLFNTLLMPVIIFFENLRINPVILKKLFKGNAVLYGKLNRRSKYIGDELTWTYRNPLHPYKYKYDHIFPIKHVKFESLMLPVQNNTHEYLINHFGETYMTPPPENKRMPKHIVDISLNSDKPEK
jgi:lipopolysaccharide cholinephosphotransferase